MTRAKKDPPPETAPTPKRPRKKDRHDRVVGLKHIVDTSQIDPIEARRVGVHKSSAFTEQARIEIKAHLEAGLPRYYAAAQAGITDRTLRTWIRRGEADIDERDTAIANGEDVPELSPYGEFARDVMAIEARARSQDVQFIRQSDDWRARAWYLERMDHRRWNAANKHQLVAEDGDGEPVDAGALLLEQLDQMAARLGRAAGRDDEDT